MGKKGNIVSSYPTDENSKYVKTMAKKTEMSISAYINMLISKDRIDHGKF